MARGGGGSQGGRVSTLCIGRFHGSRSSSRHTNAARRRRPATLAVLRCAPVAQALARHAAVDEDQHGHVRARPHGVDEPKGATAGRAGRECSRGSHPSHEIFARHGSPQRLLECSTTRCGCWHESEPSILLLVYMGHLPAKYMGKFRAIPMDLSFFTPQAVEYVSHVSHVAGNVALHSHAVL